MYKQINYCIFIILACACGRNAYGQASAASTEAMLPAGAEILLNLDSSDISGARFVILPDGSEQILSDGDWIRYWNTDSASVATEVPHTRDPVNEGGEDRSSYYKDMLCVSPDGVNVTSGGYSGFVERRLSDGEYLFSSGSMLEGISNVEYSSNGELLLLSGYGSVSLWDATKKRRIRKIVDGAEFYDATFDNSGAFVVTASIEESKIGLWETRTGRLIRSYEIPNPSKADFGTGFGIVRFSHDNKKLFAAQLNQGRIHVWNTDNDDEVANIDVGFGALSTYIISRDDRSLIVGYQNGDIGIWNLDKMNLAKIIHSGPGIVLSLSQSKDGEKILVNEQKYFRLIDLVKSKVIATFFVADNHGVAYTPSGFYVTDGDPHKAFKIIRDSEELAVDDFILLNRRPSLNEAASAARKDAIGAYFPGAPTPGPIGVQRPRLPPTTSSGPSVEHAASSVRGQQNTSAIPLQKEGATLVIPVTINNALKLNFVIDSGASDVIIPADVVLVMMRTGTLTDADFLGTQTYRLADGSTMPSRTFRIRMLKVGDIEIQNVIGSTAGIEGSLLLGQSFLSRFGSWSIDNSRQVLLLNPTAPAHSQENDAPIKSGAQPNLRAPSDSK
jgi:WD40 repeat protein